MEETIWENPELAGGFCYVSSDKPGSVSIKIIPYQQFDEESELPTLFEDTIKCDVIEGYLILSEHLRVLSKVFDEVYESTMAEVAYEIFSVLTDHPFEITVEKVAKVVLRDFGGLKTLQLFCVQDYLWVEDLQEKR
jgi:hypothetical protein